MLFPSWVFPPKPHPEDCSYAMSQIAKAIFVVGVGALLWSAFFLTQWVRSYWWTETWGMLTYSPVEYVVSKVGNVSFTYEVNGHRYSSQNIVFGGRPIGRVQPEGPTPVYYDPAQPESAVLVRRPAGSVVIGFLFALLSPLIARFVWVTYV